jgi:cytochrome c oxidase subunit 2
MYATWLDEEKKKVAAAAEDPSKVWTEAELVAHGQQVFMANCAACHQATGKGVPGAFPALDGSKIVLGPPEAQIALVLNGKPGISATTRAAVLTALDVSLVVIMIVLTLWAVFLLAMLIHGATKAGA